MYKNPLQPYHLLRPHTFPPHPPQRQPQPAPLPPFLMTPTPPLMRLPPPLTHPINLPLPLPRFPPFPLQPLHQLLQRPLPPHPKPRHLPHIPRRNLPHPPFARPLPRQRLCRHRKPHIPRPVHQLEDRAGRTIRLQRLDAQHAGVAAGAGGVAVAQRGEELGEVRGRVEERGGRGLARGRRIAFREGDEAFGEALGFFGFGPGGRDGFVLDEGGDEVAEEGDAVGGFAAEVPVFEGAAGHGW